MAVLDSDRRSLAARLSSAGLASRGPVPVRTTVRGRTTPPGGSAATTGRGVARLNAVILAGLVLAVMLMLGIADARVAVAAMIGGAAVGAIAAAARAGDAEREGIRAAGLHPADLDRAADLRRVAAAPEAWPSAAQNPTATAATGGALDTAARLAHELAGPLTGILTRAELALEEPVDPEARAVLEAIRDDALRGAAVCRSMVSRSRGVEPVLQQVDAAEAARRVISRHAALAVREGIGLAIHVAVGPPAHADPVALDQVLDNLVRNAIAATPAGGRVRLVVRERTGAVEIAVVDDGAGMDDVTLQRAFEPFFTTRPGHGAGLGLAIAHELAVSMGGSLAAASARGHGTTMTLRLPVAEGGTCETDARGKERAPTVAA